ncbi:DnaJ-class molecular chaperone [Sporomusaceae bacterium BoRhaA]|uniref:DnaJ domain-containing protein n=1 Tax=Pelorhabdus rhamnosifermentans TaxID=2772457 RepID=UPI001C0642FE|nr:DnaJ domain-containing protein [Pelorhabdus rhamnosifermentans]MBU2703388.1 DnaJ-class molecular chaperone [Pelorhabdus rhamnosifermentans]
MKDFYEVLEVNCNADPSEIKKNYRRLSKKYHPDLNQGNQTAEQRFKDVNEAYAVLSNTERRHEYDRKQGAAAEKKPKPSKEQGPKPKFAKSSFDVSNISRQFEHYFGFDPQSKAKSVNFHGNQHQAKDPLDTSDIFEGFFKPKKK